MPRTNVYELRKRGTNVRECSNCLIIKLPQFCPEMEQRVFKPARQGEKIRRIAREECKIERALSVEPESPVWY